MSYYIGQNFHSYKYNDRTALLLNFKAVGQTQSELHNLIIKVEKLDACTCSYKTPFHKFGHTYNYIASHNLVFCRPNLFLNYVKQNVHVIVNVHHGYA